MFEITVKFSYTVYKFEIIFTENLLRLFQVLHETLYDGRIKFFAIVSELLTHVVLQLVVVVRKTASSECILHGPNMWNSEGAKSGLQEG
jgi:hypothetical protein